MLNNPGIPLTIYDVAGRITEALEKAFTPKNIMAGFKKAGIVPFDSDSFTDEDFLCSYVTDRPLITAKNSIESPGPSGMQCAPAEMEIEVDPNSLMEHSEVLESSGSMERETDFGNSEISEQSKREKTPPIGDPLKFISPEMIRGFPKAQPRKQMQKGRKRGRSRIITETPEKDIILEEQMKKIKNKAVIKNLKSLRDEVKTVTKKKFKKQKIEDSDTSEDGEYEALSETETWEPE